MASRWKLRHCVANDVNYFIAQLARLQSLRRFGNLTATVIPLFWANIRATDVVIRVSSRIAPTFACVIRH